MTAGDTRGLTRVLTRHFFDAQFDMGFLSREGADAFIRVVLGIISVILAFGLLLTRIYMAKYAGLRGGPDAEAYLRALAADTTLAFALPMWIAAFVTVLISHSLVPDETDFRVLMPLPITQRFIFGTKLLALAIFCGIFISGSLAAITPLVAMISASRHAPSLPPVALAAYWIIGGAGCLFSILLVVSLNGVLTIAVPRSRVHGITAAVRSVMLGGLMLAVPFVFSLPAQEGRLAAHSPMMYFVPPAWFFGIERMVFGGADDYALRLARIGMAAVFLVTAVSAACYVIVYRRFDRVMLRSLQVFRISRSWCGTISDFTHATLRRSALHQGVLIGVSALGVALGINRLLGRDVIAWLQQPTPASFDVIIAVMGVPWLLMFAIGLATRAAIALPIEQRANWIFRITESDETRADQLRGVARLMHQLTVVLPLVLMAPLEWALFGPRAVFALATNAACALLWVEVLLRSWRRLPFTCSYIPGKQMVAQTTVVGLGALVLGVTVIGALAYGSTRSPVAGIVIVAVLSAVTYVFRRARLTLWNDNPLEFDDHMPSAVEGLRLS